MNITIHIPTARELHHRIVKFFYSFESRLLRLDDKAHRTLGKWYWQLTHRLTGRCGSLVTSHTPVYGNPHTWLWEVNGLTHTCVICKETIQESKRLSHVSSYSNAGRESDYTELNKLYKRAKSETAKKAVLKSMYNIRHEDARVKAMREDLIVATRNNDHDKIKEIHEYVGEKKALQQHER